MKHKKLIIDILKSNNNMLEILAKYDETEITKLTVKGQIENNNEAIKLLNQ